MPIRQRITGEARRAELLREGKALHPLLKMGTRHRAIWQLIVQEGNPQNGITAARISTLHHMYHPQVLADLKKAQLVRIVGKRNNHMLYIADPTGRGAKIQTVNIDIELYETEDGAFLTRTILHGRTKKHGKIVKHLLTRHITMDIPLSDAPGVMDVMGHVIPDAEQSLSHIEAYEPDAADNVIDATYTKED